MVLFAIIVLQLHFYYKCYVALPPGAMGWSAVCDCGISCMVLIYLHFYNEYLLNIELIYTLGHTNLIFDD